MLIVMIALVYALMCPTSRMTDIPIALLLFSIVVPLLHLILRIEEVKDHWLNGLLLLRVAHLLKLTIKFGSVSLRQLLPLLHAQVALEHDLFERMFSLHVLLSVTASGSKCAPILPHRKDNSTILSVQAVDNVCVLGRVTTASTWVRA